MKYVKVPVTTLETLIEGLENAINTCYNVDTSSNNPDRSYPFATGYSRSAMQSVLTELNTLKSQAN